VLTNILNGLTISGQKVELTQNKIGEAITPENSTMLGKLTTGELQWNQLDERRWLDFSIEREERRNKRCEVQLACCRHRFKDVKKTEEIIERLKAEGYILTSGVYSQLIELYAAPENLEEGEKMYNKIRKTDFILSEDCSALHKFEVIEFLEQNKRTESLEDKKKFNFNNLCWRFLNGMAEKGQAVELNRMLDAFMVNNLIIPIESNVGPLIKVHVVQGELKQAVDKYEEICQKYRATPWENEIALRLMQAANLQRLTDLSTEMHSEVNSPYDLVFSFVECGRIRQARKILKTTGLKTRSGKINRACERYLSGNVPSAL